VKKTEEYKYLGSRMNQKGNLERQIEEIERKALIIGREAERISKEENLGKFSTEGRLVIYEKTIAPVLTYNLDVWTKIGNGKRWKRYKGG